MAVNEYVVESVRRGEFPREAEQHGRGRAPALVHVVALVVSFVLAIVAVHQAAGKVPDDAFIMFRYAQNLLDGHGWVYNLHSSTTNAVSAPLYAVVLTLIAAVVSDVERASTLLFVVTTAISGYLAFLILHRNSMTLGGAAALCLMIVNPWLLATQGLETSAFVCLLLLSVLLHGAGRYAALGATLVAATLVRGDGAVFAAVVFLFLLLRYRRFPWRLMAGAVLAIGLWAVTALSVRIPVIPDTLAAKFAQGRSGLWGDMLYMRGFVLSPEVFGFAGWSTAAALLAGTGLLMLGGLRGLRSYLAPFVVGVAVLFAAYGLVIRPPSYHWYYGPQLALMALSGGIAVAVVARAAAVNVVRSRAGTGAGWLGPVLATSRRATTAMFIAVAVFMTGTMAVIGWRDIVPGPDRPEYLDAAAWLRDNTADDATVAMTEIGIISWYSGRDMVDFLGLLSEDSVREIAVGDAVTWLSREEPDYWIVHQPLWSDMEAAAGEPWFSLAYRPVWSNERVVVWERYRTIAEARQLLDSTIRPASDRIADQLGATASDAATRRSVDALLSVLAVRSDLRSTYAGDGRLDLEGLATWAYGRAGAVDQHGAALHPHRSTYEDIAPRAVGLELAAPPVDG